MHISDFDFELPDELIAQTPSPERDASRLLVLDRVKSRVSHRRFRDLSLLLRRGDRLVVNDTRVLPARLRGRREGGTGEIELLLLHPFSAGGDRPTIRALARPARKLCLGTVLYLGESKVRAEVVEEIDDKIRVVVFPRGFSLLPFLDREGHVPLPPYIRREDTPEDRERYQTIFARRGGAVAAPTAGLHFTPGILHRLGEAGIPLSPITLDVGVGTFAPVVEEDPRNHVMEREHYTVSQETRTDIARTRSEGGRIVAVGTTVVRTLESVYVPSSGAEGTGTIAAGDGWTDAYIYPPYQFRLVDAMVTNFHLPRSTLFMLVSAFAGLDLVHRAYEEAVRERYRFYSYGDSMLVL